MNRGQPILTRSSPTIATTRPVTSGGKSFCRRFMNRESTASNAPEKEVMPKTKERPPVLPAKMEAEIYAGPHENGHKYPEPTGPLVRACRMVARPEAIIETRIMVAASRLEAPMLVATTTTKIHPTDMTKTCCRPSTIASGRGGSSSTE